MSAGDLKRTLMDVRKMRRAVQMRKETDPEVVSQTLETILREAIALSTQGDGVMSKAAVKELQQVRKGMLAGQINAGQKTTQHVGAFSAVLDQVDQAGMEAAEEAKKDRAEMRESMLDNLPSSDTMISAIMTANPLFGYTLKMGRDLTKAAKTNAEKRRAREKREAEIRRDRLQQQEKVLNEQLETDEIVRDNAQDEQKEKKRRTGIYKPVLEEIRNEIARMNEIINGGSDTDNRQADRLEQIYETNQETTSQLEKIHDTDQEQVRLQRQQENLSDLRAEEARIEKGGVTAGTTTGAVAGLDDEGGDLGFLGSLFGGGAGGLMGSLIAPFASMFGFLKSAGGLLLKFGKFGGVLAAVKGIYDFVDGIFNAGEILGRDDVDWQDRVKVGISNVLSGLLEPINWISKTFFGNDMMGGQSRDDWTRQYFDFFDNFGENIVGMAKWIGNSIVDSFSSWASKGSDFISNLAEEAFSPLLELMEKIKNYIRDKIYELVPDFARSWFGMEEAEGGTDEPEILTRDDVARKRAKERRERLEEEVSPQARANGNATSAAEQYDAETVEPRGGRGAAPVFAPNSSQTNVNQHQYQGNGSSDNREPTHRRWSNRNGILGAGNL